jgi:putative restriction endonuclease
MSYSTPSLQSLRERFSNLRQAPQGGGRAPHKPLLILLMLGRHQRGERAAMSFESIREPLGELIRDFGPPSTGRPDTEDPFWRLQNDRGNIWEVRDCLGGIISEETHPPTIGRLLERNAVGNFAPDICIALRERPAYIVALAADLLAGHFPTSLHEDICSAVGLQLEGEIPEGREEKRSTRDPEFRVKILTAYEFRCAATGWDLRVGHSLVGLEAAHIRWHVADGPSTEQNGIALNALHHKLFDLGVFTLSAEDEVPRILVSRLANGSDAVRSMLLDYHRKPIRPPQDGEAKDLVAGRVLSACIRSTSATALAPGINTRGKR